MSLASLSAVQQLVENPLLQFTVLVVLALLMKVTVERLHLPGLIGLLVMGMFLGPDGFGILPREPLVSFLGDIGLIYVMFLAGVEIDLDIVRDHRAETLLFGLAAFALSLLPAVAAGLFLGFELPAAFLLGALISSHTLISYPVIERLKIMHRKAVVTAIGGTLITDTLALVLLAIVIQRAGGERGTLIELHWIVSLALLALLAVASWFLIPRISRLVFDAQRLATAEKALFALVVLLVLAALAKLIGTEHILGAFLAGICLNAVLRKRDELREHVEFAGRMLFIPFFFISTGMLLELDVFRGSPGVWLLAALLLFLVVVGKSLASWLTGAIYGYSTAERFTMVGLTIPQAAATLAVTVTAAEAGLFPGQVIDAVIIVIFFSCLAGPVLTSVAGEHVRKSQRSEGKERHDEKMKSI
jgi:Kef-type K+ transport system membrane component KefB